MDFFGSQDDARRKTKQLILLFVLAVISVVVIINVLIGSVIYFSPNTQRMMTIEEAVVITLTVLFLIVLGSLARIYTLSGGGSSVAEMLNCKLLVSPQNFKERRLLNVVEEMAIASGTPVPPVYLIHDSSINAFAAGYATGDAVIGVTQGAINNLDREQLQGVIAHEFSHILNGDMRLNIRLMGVLFGLFMLVGVGRQMLHFGRIDRRGAAVGLAVGVSFMVMGFVGKLFGDLIKAAVSRQREFLADASAVQFTRNPNGIAGALKRIGGYKGGSAINNSKAEELSHAFFADGVVHQFTNLLATHPPLQDRISRIDPHWDGIFLKQNTSAVEAPERESSGVSHRVPEAASGFAGGSDSGALSGDLPGPSPGAPDQAVEMVGVPGPKELAHARSLLAAIPEPVSDAAHDPFSARAIVYAALLDHEDALVRGRQMDALAESADVFVRARMKELLPALEGMAPELRLPLIELCLPALRQLSTNEYQRFKGNIKVLIKADNKVSLSEWALFRYITRHLAEALEGKRPVEGTRELKSFRDECSRLLSMLARVDAVEGTVESAFAAAREELAEDISLMAPVDLSLAQLDSALNRLARLHPLRKPRLIKACVAAVSHDGVISATEGELIRTIADSLDCPMSPLV